LVALVAACAGFLAVYQYRRSVYNPTFALIREAQYADAAGKLAAIRSLLEKGETSPAVVETLFAKLHDADVAVRALAARAVADVAYARRHLAGVKNQDDPYFGAAQAALTASLKDRDPSVRLRAASGLELLGVKSEECFAILLRAARPDGDPAGRFLPGGEPDDRLRALGDLAHGYRHKPETQAAILEAISDRDPRARKQGLIALHFYVRGLSGPVPQPIAMALFARLDDEDDPVCAQAAQLLSLLGRQVAPRAVPLLAGKLSSPKVSARVWAADALREFKLEAEEALPALRALAGGPGEAGPDRIAATKAVDTIAAASRIFHEQTLPTLVTNLSSDDPDVRDGAAGAIAEYGPRAKAAIPDLTRTLTDPDPKVRRRASAALEAVGATRTGPTRE
jgi:HEAT repeat protein